MIHFTSGEGAIGNAAESARRAGYSAHSAKEIGRKLLTLQHVRDAIDEANRNRLAGPIASKAVALLERAIDDETVPMRTRVEAAKTILDRAGIVAPPAVLIAERANRRDKPASEMTLPELEAAIARFETYLAGTGGKVQDVTPKPATIQHIPAAVRHGLTQGGKQ